MTQVTKYRIWYLITISYLTLLISMYFHTGFDTYWHIKVGEWIINNKTIPNTGLFSSTFFDQPWTPHSWLSEVIIYFIHSTLGWPGLTLLGISAVTLSIFFMLSYLLKKLPPIRALSLMVMAYGTLYAHIMPRPHILALPIMTFWFIQMLQASENNKPPSIYNLFLMIIWANIHGSFIIGIAYASFFALEAVLTAQQNINKSQLTKDWLYFIILTIACTLITPHGIDTLLLPLQLTNQDFITSHVSEWISPNFQDLQFLEVWIIAIIGFSLTQKVKFPVLRVLFLIGLIHLSLKHGRYSPDLLSIQAPLLLASPLARHWNINLKNQIKFSLKTLFPVHLLEKILLFTFTLTLLYYIFSIKQQELDKSVEINKTLTVLNQSKTRGNVFNSYDIGGYLIYHGFNTFIDSRAELYKDKFIEKYFYATNLYGSTEKLEKLLSQYNIHWIMLSATTPAIVYLDMHPNWLRIFSSKFLVIHIRKDIQQLPEYQKMQSNLLILEKNNKKSAISTKHIPDE